MAEYENKYIVIKISDYEKYKKEAQEEKYEHGEFRLGRKSKNIHSFEEMVTEFDNQNDYVVINLDEPYAKAVLDIVLAFENLKEKMMDLERGVNTKEKAVGVGYVLYTNLKK